MRANVLPDEKELTKDLRIKPERRGREAYALRLAIRATELLLEEDLLPRRTETKMLLGQGAFKLPHFPIRNLEIDGQKKGNFDPDELNGILYARLEPNLHTISYDVGYPKGQLPAVGKALITSIGRYYLSGDEEDRNEAVELIKTGRRLRQKAKEERDAYQVDREGEG